MNVLVTGGAGYIGSHTIIELYKAGHTAVIVDNLSNSSREAVQRLDEILDTEVPLYVMDCADKPALEEVFDKHTIDAAIHFAGLKSVNESVAQPLQYYHNNIDSTLALCELMQERDVRNLIFSSSASVYGPPSELPLTEDSRVGVGITNAYGHSKYMIEEILRDLSKADASWNITILRYFNPVGAHESGKIGEDPNGKPNNLLPYISQVAVGKLPSLTVTGDDYDTVDGTGVRDYIHIIDLAEGHIAALNHISDHTVAGDAKIYNLGTGQGVSVLEAVKAFEQASGKKVNYEITPRRAGDIAACYADCSKAGRELDWHTKRTFEQACQDAWRWQSGNPNGYKS